MASQTIPPTGQMPALHHTPRRTMDLRIPALEKYAYCLCLHVKPTTIFIAVFKLIRALLFATIILNTEVILSDRTSELTFGPTALDDRHRSTAAAMTLLTRIMIASVSAVGIYAVVSGRAALLMPLYAMLLVDFFFSLPSIYNRDLDNSFSDSWAPVDLSKSHGGAIHPTAGQPNTRFAMILIPTITMLVKLYFLCVVWKCYRYLRLIELVTPIRLSEIYPHIPPVGPQYPIVRVLGSIDSTDMSSGQNVTPPPYDSVASSMKPPNYEEAIKSSSALVTSGGTSGIATTTDQNLPVASATDQHASHQAHQTIVFTIPASDDQRQGVSTQVIGQTESMQNAASRPVNAKEDHIAIPVTGQEGSSTPPINNQSHSSNNNN